MVIERFKNGDARAIGERFRRSGRMMPDDEKYVSSWVDAKEMRCFQIMEAPAAESLRPWIDSWKDLVDFEVVAVQASQEFWEKTPTK